MLKTISINKENEKLIIDSQSQIFINHMNNGSLKIEAKASADILFVIKEQDLISKIDLNLAEPNIEVNVKFLAVTKDAQNFKVSFKTIHKSPRTDCNFKFFGFAFDESSLAIQANNSIEKGNKESNTHQILKVLSDQNAKVKGEPGLFIDEFDVTASHGNSIGQIDQRSLYYLQSRGIDKKKARWMIIEGEVKSLLSNFDAEFTKEILNQIKTIMGVANV